MTERPYDEFFGKLIRLLDALDLEMHTPMRGPTYTCKRRPKRPRFQAVIAAPDLYSEDLW